MLLNEVSTFFVNYRAFLLNYEMGDSKYYLWNAGCFLLTFFLFRIVLNSVMFYFIIKIVIETDVTSKS